MYRYRHSKVVRTKHCQNLVGGFNRPDVLLLILLGLAGSCLVINIGGQVQIETHKSTNYETPISSPDRPVP